jgi:hypothetical protein
MVHIKPLVAGTLGSAALMAGAAAALAGGPASPVAAAPPVAQHATLTADVTQAATPAITYQQPYFFGLFSTSRQLSPGDVLTFSDNSTISVLPDYSLRYTDPSGEFADLTTGGVLLTPDGGKIFAGAPIQQAPLPNNTNPPAEGFPISDPSSQDPPAQDPPAQTPASTPQPTMVASTPTTFDSGNSSA